MYICFPYSISQIELATGKFPYPKWTSVFDQLTAVVMGDPPQLSNDDPSRNPFTPEFIDFVNTW
jgi:mitogen-activated protein kinase kinase 4